MRNDQPWGGPAGLNDRKNLPGKSPKAINPVGQALRKAAMAARRSQTFIGASTAQGSPEWTPPLRSRRPPENSPA